MSRLEIHVSGRYLVARVADGAVVLDEETRSIFELVDAAAEAFDVLADIQERWPTSNDRADQIRRVMRGLRRDMFGERFLGPHESVAIDGPNGERLFRRYPEPGHWRSIGRSTEPGVRGALLRIDRGAVLFLGGPSVTSGLAHCFVGAGLEAIGRDDVTVSDERALAFRSGAWGETIRALEVWNVDVRPHTPQKLTRHAPTRALLRLTLGSLTRPTFDSLATLARCAQELPNLALEGPVDFPRMVDAIARYHGAQ